MSTDHLTIRIDKITLAVFTRRAEESGESRNKLIRLALAKEAGTVERIHQLVGVYDGAGKELGED